GRPGKFELLDVYDVTKLARDRSNRIVASMRSANGVGGLLLAIDLSPTVENYLVTDKRWKIHRAWDRRLLVADVDRIHPERPRSLGRPPFGRWNYLKENERALYPTRVHVVAPHRTSRLRTTRDRIKVVSGVAIATSMPVVATAFDFGRLRGRTAVELPREGPSVVDVRFAVNEDDLMNGRYIESLVLAKGERRVVDSEERTFRYVVVYGADAKVAVLKRQ
ncbi:MAG TPA: hypothetical protein VIL97_04575, partial [Thermoanaerobaculia bacterium]